LFAADMANRASQPGNPDTGVDQFPAATPKP